MVSGKLKIAEKAPLRYPKSVAFIISNEFCERFNYYGMRTILVLYLTKKLNYTDDTATVLFHVFTMLVYLFPLIGAIVADSWLGKFRTILNLSIVYAIGGVIVAIGAVPVLSLPVKEVTILGLVLIAIGTGGIKPCVSAFGGDQFKLPEQVTQLARFFSLFYFAINAGSMISTSITPILREDVHCFGDKDCFSVAFGVPAILMLLSVVIFVAGKKLYVMKPPAGNMIFGVSKCIANAFSGWRCERKTNPQKHFLDYAEKASGHQMVADTKTLMKILVLYLPFPVFWALFDQQGSRWTFQANQMNGDFLGYTIKPDQMQVINPLLILGFIPLFDYVLYPLLSKLGIRRPLQKLTMGGLLAAAAFVLSGLLQLKLQSESGMVPLQGAAQIRIYNGMSCEYKFKTDLPGVNDEVTLNPLSFWETRVDIKQPTSYAFIGKSSDSKCVDVQGYLRPRPAHSLSYYLNQGSLAEFEEPAEPAMLATPAVRVMLNTPNDGLITLTDAVDKATDLEALNCTHTVTVAKGEATLTINGKQITSIDAKPGGIYSILVSGNVKDGFTSETHIMNQPNSVHMFWQLPQIIVITAAEIMFSVTGLEFSFTQAPQSMKSVLQACWLLSVAIGNMLVVVIAEMKFFESQAAEFFLFAALMVVDMFIFMLLAMRYQYVEHHDDPEAGQIENASKAVMENNNGSGKHSADRKSENGGHYNEGYSE